MTEKKSHPSQGKPLAKSYEPETFETATYPWWDELGAFHASDKNSPGQSSFCIVIPPPNVTGVLHMGHALGNTIQDTLTRWRRMRGDNSLWLPGTDHAGIATQAQVEKALAKEKTPEGKPLTRHHIGREAFLKRTWKWKEDHEHIIRGQTKRLGASLDWRRERFTMDEGLSRAVKEVFVRLHEEGLIYRGERIINWCPRCQTALSDLEAVPTERKGSFWHIAYEVEGDLNNRIVIATTRPETLLGDTAIAVHPEDERFKRFIGKKAVLPLLGRLIPIVADTYVDPAFGNGALKVTPAHDFNDYEIGKRHGLPFVTVIGKDGRINAEGGPYAGLKAAEAREKVVEDLKSRGQLVKVEDHQNQVGLCQRCDHVAEPLLSKQWFVKIAPLAKPAIEAVETGKIEFYPKSWEKTYFEWMYNIRDWCISRQLWWGHQIPAWYCADCETVTVARSAPAACSGCKGSRLTQDEDVLDTWFSSALWPFSTLGWPDRTDALKTFYPTSVMETGFDIIFFWVARMIMMGLHFMGDVPFRKVYLHAMVRDEKGQKMSKTRGNTIDPLDVISKQGADPLRFTLLAMAGQGRDIKLSVDRVEGYRAFCNKLWNAVKFFHLQYDGGVLAEGPDGVKTVVVDEAARGALAPRPAAWLGENRSKLAPPERWILSRLAATGAAVDRALAAFEMDEAARVLYEFTWGELCDWYVELSKPHFRQGGQAREAALNTLFHVEETLLRLMHPLMPFVTEELWQSLPPTHVPVKTGVARSLMLQEFPTAESLAGWRDEESERTIDRLKVVVNAIRNFRGENNVSPKVELRVSYRAAADGEDARFLESYREDIQELGRISAFTPVANSSSAGPAGHEALIPLPGMQADFRVDLRGVVDAGEEVKRVRKEIEKTRGDLEFIQNKLGKESFIAKAPADLVAKEKARQAEIERKLGDLQESLSKLEKLARGAGA